MCIRDRSKILKSHAVCLTSDGLLSIEMEKVLSQMPAEHDAKEMCIRDRALYGTGFRSAIR